MFNEKPYKFSKKSASELETCHEDLQMIMREVIKYYDFAITCGNRNEIDQNKAFESGVSKVKFPDSDHNTLPSLAIDVVPCPIDWKDIQRFGEFIRFIQGFTLGRFNIKLQSGLDWNGDWRKNERFYDYPHLKLDSKLIDGHWIKY